MEPTLDPPFKEVFIVAARFRIMESPLLATITRPDL